MHYLSSLHDHFEITLLPLLRLKPLYLLRNGIFCDAERISDRKDYSKITVYPRAGSGHEFHLLALSEFAETSASLAPLFSDEPQPVTTADHLLKNIGQKIADDLKLLPVHELIKPEKMPCQILGTADSIFVHNTAHINSYCVLDATEGPVVIDAGVEISAFSVIKGPAYVGSESRLDRVSFSGSICGRANRLGGEIENSILGDFTNKHHEGFLGHSLVGDWVNLGALTTTSDLKNNYGEIRLTFGDTKFETGRIKFGSIIGDYVKTGIGTLLNTGSILDFGAMVTAQPALSPYTPPFSWPGGKVYERKRFLSDAARIMARRKQTLSESKKKIIGSL